jgi:hypothetical protein
VSAAKRDEDIGVLVRLPLDVLEALDRGCAGRSRAAVLRGIVAAAVCPPPDLDAQVAAVSAWVERVHGPTGSPTGPRGAHGGGSRTLRDALDLAGREGWEEVGAGAQGHSVLLRLGARYALLWREPALGWVQAEVPT